MVRSFGMVWTLALAGVLMKSFGDVRLHKISLAIHLGMGWLVVIAIMPLVERMPPAGLAWLVAGGLAYTSSRPPSLLRIAPSVSLLITATAPKS